MTRARSLSRLANSNVFTVSDTNRVGIGSTIPDAKLDVTGNIEVAGIITAAAGAAVTYYGDGSGLTGVASTDYIITGTAATFNNQVTIQNLYVGAATTIQGTLSYEDVTNVDSIGIITARSHVSIADSIIHTGDTDTSIRFPAANTFTVETAGSERVRVDNSGNSNFGAEKAVAFPSGTGIQVYHSSSPRIKLVNDTTGNGSSDGSYLYISTSNFVIENKENAALQFNTNATERVRITSAGRVGIGTDDPDRLLVVAGSDPIIRSEDTDTGNNYAEFKQLAGSLFIDSRNDASDGTIIFRGVGGGSATEKIRIGSAGEIGLGGANYGTSGQVLTSNGSGSAVTWEDASGGGITTEAATPSNAITQINLTNATDHKVTATGICTITTTTAGTEGQSHTIRIVNSGIATVGFSTYFLFPSGSAPSLPTADGAISIISFTVHDSVGAGCTQLLAGASLNFS